MLKVREMHIQNAMHFQGGKNSFKFGAHWRLSAGSGIWLRTKLESVDNVLNRMKNNRNSLMQDRCFLKVLFFSKY